MDHKSQLDYMHPIFRESGCDAGDNTSTGEPIGCNVGLTDYLANRRSTAADGLDGHLLTPPSCSFYKTKTQSMDNLNCTISEITITANNNGTSEPCQVLSNTFDIRSIGCDSVRMENKSSSSTSESRHFTSQTSSESVTTQSSQTKRSDKTLHQQISSHDSNHTTHTHSSTSKSDIRNHYASSRENSRTDCTEPIKCITNRLPVDTFNDMREPPCDGIISVDSGIEDAYETPLPSATYPAMTAPSITYPITSAPSASHPVTRRVLHSSETPLNNSRVQYTEVSELPSSHATPIILPGQRNTFPVSVQSAPCPHEGPRLPRRPNTHTQDEDPSYAEYCEIDDDAVTTARRGRLQNEQYTDYRGYDPVCQLKIDATTPPHVTDSTREDKTSTCKPKDVAVMIEVYVMAVQFHESESKGHLKLVPGMKIKQKEPADKEGYAYGWTRHSKLGKKKYGRYPIDKVIHLPRRH